MHQRQRQCCWKIWRKTSTNPLLSFFWKCLKWSREMESTKQNLRDRNREILLQFTLFFTVGKNIQVCSSLIELAVLRDLNAESCKSFNNTGNLKRFSLSEIWFRKTVSKRQPPFEYVVIEYWWKVENVKRTNTSTADASVSPRKNDSQSLWKIISVATELKIATQNLRVISLFQIVDEDRPYVDQLKTFVVCLKCCSSPKQYDSYD